MGNSCSAKPENSVNAQRPGAIATSALHIYINIYVIVMYRLMIEGLRAKKKSKAQAPLSALKELCLQCKTKGLGVGV